MFKIKWKKITIISFMKYSEKYDLYIDDDLVIYYWNKKLDKLMQSTIKDSFGYLKVWTKMNDRFVHRIIYETFVGHIPDGYQIDHINTIKTDNRLENLRCVTPKENTNNPLTLKHKSDVRKGVFSSKDACNKISNKLKGNTNAKGKPTSEFGRKFKEYYGITRYQNYKLYFKEFNWYHTHNHKCRWE